MLSKTQVHATQSLKLCYAGCYAKPFDKAKARRQNRLDSVARFVLKLCDKTKNKASGCGVAVLEEKTVDNRFFKEGTETRKNEAKLRSARILTMFQEESALPWGRFCRKFKFWSRGGGKRQKAIISLLFCLFSK